MTRPTAAIAASTGARRGNGEVPGAPGDSLAATAIVAEQAGLSSRMEPAWSGTEAARSDGRMGTLWAREHEARGGEEAGMEIKIDARGVAP